jgi:CRP-like cAMP-binding protein
MPDPAPSSPRRRSSPAFRESRARLLALARPRHYAKGDILFVEVQKGDEFILIQDGSVSVQVALRNSDDPYDIGLLGSGEVLGEVNLVEEGIRSATAIAESDTDVLVWDCAALRAACDEDPALGYPLILAVSKILAERLRKWNVRILDSALWGIV